MRSTLLILCLFFYPFAIYTQQNEVEAQIKTNKTVFYHGESIPLFFQILNPGLEPITLTLSEYTFFNYFIEVYTLEKVSVKERDHFFALQIDTKSRLQKMSPQDAQKFFQTFVLYPAQIHGLKMDLTDYYQLKPGIYLLRGIFYPSSSFYQPKSSIATPFIRIVIQENELQREETIKNKQLLEEELKNITTPDLAIRAFFDGKMTQKWEKFFYVLDLRKLITQFDIFYKAFENSPDEEKKNVLRDFKKFLQDLNSDEKILNYEIEETHIKKNYAVSRVVVNSRFRDTFIKREYRIGLQLKDRWYIYGYTVIQK